MNCLLTEMKLPPLLYRAVFNRVTKVISQLLWFCIASLCDWLNNLALLSQPIRSTTKTNRDFPVRVFPRLVPLHVFAASSDWLIGLFTTAVIGQNNYFGFGFTILK